MSGAGAQLADVSRETTERLELFQQLLRKWNPSINLVSKNSLKEAWARHIEDSSQVFFKAPEVWSHWVDLGTGGGFPGAVVAILNEEFKRGQTVTLIESDARKASFLRTVLRETQTEADVLVSRIEAAPRQYGDVVSARALAPLSTLLGYCERHLVRTGTAILPKGKNWKNEVRDAQDAWKFAFQATNSDTETDAVILKVKDIHHV